MRFTKHIKPDVLSVSLKIVFVSEEDAAPISVADIPGELVLTIRESVYDAFVRDVAVETLWQVADDYATVEADRAKTWIREHLQYAYEDQSVYPRHSYTQRE